MIRCPTLLHDIGSWLVPVRGAVFVQIVPALPGCLSCHMQHGADLGPALAMAPRSLDRDEFCPIQQGAHEVGVGQGFQGGVAVIGVVRHRTWAVVVPAVESYPCPSTILPWRPSSTHGRQDSLTCDCQATLSREGFRSGLIASSEFWRHVLDIGCCTLRDVHSAKLHRAGHRTSGVVLAPSGVHVEHPRTGRLWRNMGHRSLIRRLRGSARNGKCQFCTRIRLVNLAVIGILSFNVRGICLPGYTTARAEVTRRDVAQPRLNVLDQLGRLYRYVPGGSGGSDSAGRGRRPEHPVECGASCDIWRLGRCLDAGVSPAGSSPCQSRCVLPGVVVSSQAREIRPVWLPTRRLAGHNAAMP